MLLWSTVRNKKIVFYLNESINVETIFRSFFSIRSNASLMYNEIILQELFIISPDDRIIHNFLFYFKRIDRTLFRINNFSTRFYNYCIGQSTFPFRIYSIDQFIFIIRAENVIDV